LGKSTQQARIDEQYTTGIAGRRLKKNDAFIQGYTEKDLDINNTFGRHCNNTLSTTLGECVLTSDDDD